MTTRSTFLADVSLYDSAALLRMMKEKVTDRSFEQCLDDALKTTSWTPNFAHDAFFFLRFRTVSPSFLQQRFPDECMKYDFPVIENPLFVTLVDMYNVLAHLGVSASELSPLLWEVRDHPNFPTSDVKDTYPFFKRIRWPYYPGNHTETIYTEKILINELVYRGFLSVLQNIPFERREKQEEIYTSTVAAAQGHVHVLQWLRAQDPPFPWDTDAVEEAAEGGHLSLLQWMYAQDPSLFTKPHHFEIAAIREGHLSVLAWLRKLETCSPLTEEHVRAAEANGFHHILQWLPTAPYVHVCEYASCSGHIPREGVTT
jgi:hypothetical protein